MSNYIKAKKVQKKVEMLIKNLYVLKFIKHSFKFLQEKKIKQKRRINGQRINSFIKRRTSLKFRNRNGIDNYFRTQIQGSFSASAQTMMLRHEAESKLIVLSSLIKVSSFQILRGFTANIVRMLRQIQATFNRNIKFRHSKLLLYIVKWNQSLNYMETKGKEISQSNPDILKVVNQIRQIPDKVRDYALKIVIHRVQVLMSMSYYKKRLLSESKLLKADEVETLT